MPIALNNDENNNNKTYVSNDPLGQTHSSTSSDHYFQTTFALFCDVLKSTDGRTNGNMCENNDHYLTGLWDGRVDQRKTFAIVFPMAI